MNSEVIIINCLNFGLFNFYLKDYIRNHLKHYKIVRRKDEGFFLDLHYVGQNIRLVISREWKEDIHVCVLGWIIDGALKKFEQLLKSWASDLMKTYSNLPVILAGYFTEVKNDPAKLQ